MKKIFPMALKYDSINKYNFINMFWASIHSVKKEHICLLHWGPSASFTFSSVIHYFVEHFHCSQWNSGYGEGDKAWKKFTLVKDSPRVIFPSVYCWQWRCIGNAWLCALSPPGPCTLYPLHFFQNTFLVLLHMLFIFHLQNTWEYFEIHWM